MIIFDIETSGLTDRHGICQIGALEFENPDNYFLEESRIDDEDEIMEGAMRANGRSEQVLRDLTKQSQKKMIENFLNWLEQFGERIAIGANIGFDLTMIQGKCIKYGLEERFHNLLNFRGIDLLDHAQEIYYRLNGHYLISSKGTHGMPLSEALKFSGIPDERVGISLGNVVKQGKAHDALEDCKLEGECFSRLKFGKNLFPEYSKFEIPDHLRK